MKWIVLSDLHMKYNNFATKQAQEGLLKTLEKERGKISFILITGDCFLKNEGNVNAINQYIRKIAHICGIKINRVILCPGNHDVDRTLNLRNQEITQYREHGGELPDLDICLDGYGKFNELYALFYRKKYQPFTIKCIDNFRIISIDSCLLSMDDKDYGHLNVNFPSLCDLKIEEDDKINIVMMHHGIEWFQPEEGRRFQHWLVEHNVRMVFCGHNHTPGMSVLTEAISDHGIARDGIPQFTCGCALSNSFSTPVFLMGEYIENTEEDYRKTEKQDIQITLYKYQGNSRWEIANGELRSFESGIYRESRDGGLIKNTYDIPIVYKSIYDLPEENIVKEIESGKKIYFYGLRGRRFLQGNSKISDAIYKKKNQIEFKILVSDPYNANIERRLKNVEKFSKQDALERQWKTIYEDIKNLRDNFPKYLSWGIRFHKQPLYFR